jgi:dephospho-CoA kinase
MVVKAELDFLRTQHAKGEALAVLEIPLLFETDAIDRVDVAIVVSAPEEAQRRRVLARPGMSVERLEHLLTRQLPDADKRARADYIVDSGTSLADMHRQIDKILESLRGREGRVMQRLR